MNKNLSPKLLGLGCAIALSLTPAFAQNETKPARTEGNAASAQSKEAPRSASATPVEEKSSTDPHSESDTPQEKPAPVTPAKAVVKQTDPVMELRSQIDAAATPQEKLRLQFQLVDLMVANGAKQEAINQLRVMTVEDRFDPQGFYNIGNALARLGDSDGAIHAYQKAIEQKKGHYSRAHNNLGVLLMRQGHWDESYEAFTSALRTENFRYAEASYNLGRLYAAQGQHDLAVREWRRAVAVNPEHTAAAQALANASKEGRVSVAPVAPRRTATTASKQPVTAPMATRPTRVERVSSNARPLNVDGETYDLLQRARSARERDRSEEAVTNYRKVLARMGGYFPPANLELGYVLITLKQPEDALASLLPVTQNDGPRYPISYYHVARLYEARGDLKLAEENFTKAAASYKQDNTQFLLDVSRVREKLGDYQGALSILEEYLAIMERRHLRPEWSADRLASLRERAAASPSKP